MCAMHSSTICSEYLLLLDIPSKLGENALTFFGTLIYTFHVSQRRCVHLCKKKIHFQKGNEKASNLNAQRIVAKVRIIISYKLINEGHI